MLRSEDRPMPRSDAQPDAQFDRQPGAGRRRSVDLSVYLVTDTEQCGGVDGVVRTCLLYTSGRRGGLRLLRRGTARPGGLPGRRGRGRA